MDSDKAERLYLRAMDIRDGRANGLWVPILRHLALRGHAPSMIDLADWLSSGPRNTVLGIAPVDRSSSAALYRRACRRGDARAAQHLSRSCFNGNDLIGYRHWLHRGARMGDAEAAAGTGMVRNPVAPHKRPGNWAPAADTAGAIGYSWRSEPLPALKRG